MRIQKGIVKVIFLVVWMWGIGLLFPVNVIAQTGQVTLSWNAVTQDTNGNPITGATYNAYRGFKPDCSDCVAINLLPISATTYVDTTITPTGVYYFAVTALLGSKESAKSSIVRFSLSDGTPKPPGGLQLKGTLTVGKVSRTGAQFRAQVQGLEGDSNYTAVLVIRSEDGSQIEVARKEFRTP